MKNGYYYLGWGWRTDENIEPEMGEYDTYEKALEEAKKSHKNEIAYQREKCGRNSKDEIPSTYVYYIEDGNEYMMAKISGWRSKVEEWEYE